MCKKILALSSICFLFIMGTHWGFTVPAQKDSEIAQPVFEDRGTDAQELFIETGESWLGKIQKGIAEREYHVSRNSRGLQAPNRAHNLRTYFDRSGIGVVDRTATDGPELLRLSLADIGRNQEAEGRGQGARTGLLDTVSVQSEGSRVELRRDGITEWFVNGPNGLEHGFTIHERPDGDGALRVIMKVSAANAEREGDHIVFSTPSNRRLKYGDLHVEDARGKEVYAALEAPDPGTICILIRDHDSVYPLSIDPLLTSTPDAMVESDQVEARLGISVADAGDVNGDGYADVIVGAYSYDNGQTDEGVAFVYHGSASGISTTAAAMVESDQEVAQLGHSVSSAGDVNGDGYADVIAGAPSYDNGQDGEGAAFVYHGGVAGISTVAAAMVESDQDYANLGTGVSSAGDVNGDGFSDVIVGAWRFDNGQFDEGAAFVYHGSASGISTTAAAMVEADQDLTFMGHSVSDAGDVNGDGFADVIVGASSYDNGHIDEGVAFVYHGSATGISTIAAVMVEPDQEYAYLGYNVSGAGDVNGDGFADVIVGVFSYDNGQTDEGAALVYHGNSDGRPVLAGQFRGNGDTTPVQPWGISYDSDDFQVQMIATHPDGLGRVKLEVEYCGPGVPFGDVSCGTVISSTWTDTTLSGVNLTETISGLTADTLYRWRARVLYAPYTGITSPINPAHGPWRRLSGQNSEADIRVGAGGPQNPLPDIKANGSDGPVFIEAGDNLSLTVGLNAGDFSGYNADWWVVDDTPFGWYYYDVVNDLWKPGFVATYQGGLKNLSPYEVWNQTLSVGTYTIYFGVDMNMNGVLDIGQTYYDSVVVTVMP